MEGTSKHPEIGFPSPLLGARNLRLEVLHLGGGLIAIDKPAGIIAAPHPWHRGVPSLSVALDRQLAARKPELERLGLGPKNSVEAVYHMDPDIAGVCVLALDEQSAARARNDFGSTLWKLRFELLAIGGPESGEAECSLPVARHRELPLALVSSTTGKKTSTRFRRLEQIGKYALWEAHTDYYRPGQMPLHASETGIRIVGERTYSREDCLYLSKVKRGWEGDRETETPMYNATHAWLAEVTLADGTHICAPPPPRLASALKQLRRHAGGR